MAWQLTSEANRLCITLSAEFCIPELAQLHREWCGRWSAGMDLRLDLATVSEIDSAALQWLLFMRRWAASQGVDCTLVAIASPVAELAKLYRLTADLGLTDEAANEEGDHSHVG